MGICGSHSDDIRIITVKKKKPVILKALTSNKLYQQRTSFQSDKVGAQIFRDNEESSELSPARNYPQVATYISRTLDFNYKPHLNPRKYSEEKEMNASTLDEISIELKSKID